MCLELSLAVCTCTQSGGRGRAAVHVGRQSGVWTSNGKARNSSSSPLSTHAQLRGRIRTSKRLEQPERARRARRNLQKPWRPAASLARRTRRWEPGTSSPSTNQRHPPLVHAASVRPRTPPPASLFQSPRLQSHTRGGLPNSKREGLSARARVGQSRAAPRALAGKPRSPESCRFGILS